MAEAHAGAAPGKVKVRQYSIEESPLSQFGLDPNLHKQCNTFNQSGNACGTCQACRAWVDGQLSRAAEGARLKLLPMAP